MLKQLKDLTGLLPVPIVTSFQKRQLCSPNNIHFLFSRLFGFLLINLEISRLSIPKAFPSQRRKRRYPYSHLTMTNIFHSSCQDKSRTTLSRMPWFLILILRISVEQFYLFIQNDAIMDLVCS